MPNMIHQLTAIYVTLADFFASHPQTANWRQSNHSQPAFSDAEVLAIAFMQSYFQTPTLKRTYLLVRANDPTAFPHLPSYQQWLARLHKLTAQLGQLLIASTPPDTYQSDYYVLDSKPIALCLPIRHGRVRLLRDEGAYFGKSTKGWFFGFKLHLVCDPDGRLLNAVLTPANYDDRSVAFSLMAPLPATVAIGDLGYRGWPVKEQVGEETGILLLTRADAPQKRELISTVRQGIETTFSQLWHQFIDRVYSRSWLGLWNTIQLKLISYQLRHSGLLAA
jgi:transposase